MLHRAVFRLVLLFFFGPPRLAMALRVLGALTRLCPCAPGDGLCQELHREAAAGIAAVALERPSPEHEAALLVGVAVHETCARVEHQAHGGPAVTVYQLEVRPQERAALLADPVLAARTALRAAGGCGGSLQSYATGTCSGGGEAGARKAAELRASVLLAWYALSR